MPIVVATCSINVGSTRIRLTLNSNGKMTATWEFIDLSLILIQNNEQNEYQKRYCLLSEQGGTIAKRP